MDQEKFDSWALVELFGHQRIVGRVTEATIGGCALLRVDVPARGDLAAFTKFYGNGAIYAMTPVSEAVAMAMLERIRPEPISRFDLPQIGPASAAAIDHDDDDDDDDDISDDDGPSVSETSGVETGLGSHGYR